MSMKSIKLKNTVKRIITTVAMLTLCCSTLSYAGYDKNQDKIPVFYWLDDEYEAIEFDQAITNASAYFGAQQAFQKHSPAKYRLLHDVKQHHFQRQQIALMQDVLIELKAIKHALANHSTQKEAGQLKPQSISDAMGQHTVLNIDTVTMVDHQNIFMLEHPLKSKTAKQPAIDGSHRPNLTASNADIDVVLSSEFKLMRSAEIIALANEIAKHIRGQDDLTLLIKKALAQTSPPSITPLKTKEETQ